MRHPPDCHKKVWPFQNFHQLVEKGALVTTRLRLQVFFQNTLRIADGLKS
ncbi:MULTISPECIES: hypothetical protein [unclassified Bradyrhizobium]|jgi:hypothetical protein|nr:MULTISPECIES: hypothetical protein [unclassified Bradyrhizobium]